MSNVIELITETVRKKRQTREVQELLEEAYGLADDFNFHVNDFTQKLDKIIHKLEVLSDENI